MDDNPWGEPTPPTTSLPTPGASSPVVEAIEAPAEEVPAWSEAPAQAPPAAAEEKPVEAVDEPEAGDGGKKKKNKKKKKKGAAKAVEEADAKDDDAEDEPQQEQDQVEEPVAEEAAVVEPEASQVAAELTPVEMEVVAPVTASTEVEVVAAPAPPPAPAEEEAPAALSESEPPMDDFPDDDGFGDDDFGEMGGEGGDDDFGDFEDFDAGDAGEAAFANTAAFEAQPPAPVQPPQPVASTSGLPPLRLDWANPTRKALGPALEGWWDEMNPSAKATMTDEPERQVDGVGQVLVNENLRSLLSAVSSLPPLRPLDWRRSKVRREHLVSMGVPVNLDDSAAVPALASLVIDPAPRAATPSLRISTASPGPNSGMTASPTSAGPQISRSSTPQGLDRYLPHSPAPPPLDKARVESLCAIGEEDLALLSVTKLRAMVDELDRLSVDASGVLTHALLLREKEVGDGETYQGMIQDLISAAAKMKTTTKGGAPSRQGSGSRWGSKVR